MQRYIEQLIDDIHKATWDLKPPHPMWEESGADPDNELELEDLSYVEQYLEGDLGSRAPLARVRQLR